jgi:hypothetical protein
MREIETLSKEFCLLSLSQMQLSLIKPSLVAGTALCFALNKAKGSLQCRDYCQMMYYWEIIVSMYLSGRSTLEVEALSEDILHRFSYIIKKQGKKLPYLFSLSLLSRHIPDYSKP